MSQRMLADAAGFTHVIDLSSTRRVLLHGLMIASTVLPPLRPSFSVTASPSLASDCSVFAMARPRLQLSSLPPAHERVRSFAAASGSFGPPMPSVYMRDASRQASSEPSEHARS